MNSPGTKENPEKLVNGDVVWRKRQFNISLVILTRVEMGQRVQFMSAGREEVYGNVVWDA